jgi:integrase
MKELTISRIVEGKIYFESTQKTKKRVVIPILPPVQRIIDKYNGELPYQYHDVTVNRRIKVIASLEGITKKEEIKISELPVFIRENLKALILDRKIERLKETVLIPKNELITNHTARRSFITNMLRKGISLDRVQGATGLSFATIERKYNKATAEELAGDWPQDLLKAI